MTETERHEMRMQMRQTALWFRKVCAEATTSIQAFCAAWDERRVMVSTADIRRGWVDLSGE